MFFGSNLWRVFIEELAHKKTRNFGIHNNNIIIVLREIAEATVTIIIIDELIETLFAIIAER